MTLSVRPAGLEDIDEIATLFVQDAETRCQTNPTLWAMRADAVSHVAAAIRGALESENPPFRQQWLLAEHANVTVGVSHAIHLPVPPIYAGAFGRPGLIMEDCYVSPDAPPETGSRLFAAAEADLVANGARLLLASAVPGGSWSSHFVDAGYAPLTMYFAKSVSSAASDLPAVRSAGAADVDSIVALSHANRTLLADLHSTFWKAHPDADQRFGAWMHKSLSLADRDMFVAPQTGPVEGYAISQPATPLHIPAAHNPAGIGIIDDFFHRDLADLARLASPAKDAAALLTAAEEARHRRGDHSVLVVCPAAWASKIDLLEQAGYRNAITWYLKVLPAN